MAKTYPDHTLEQAIRETGAQCMCLWEMPGPKNTAIAWMVGYAAGQGVVIVQTYKDGGWDAFTPLRSNKVDETIRDVLERLNISQPVAA